MRCAPDQRWSAEMIGKVIGSPAEPKPGSGSDKIQTYTKHREEQVQNEQFQKSHEVAGTPVRPAYIYTNDVINNGASPHCKACSMALRRGNSTGYTHTAACRLRFEDIFKSINPERLRRADARMDEAVYRESGDVGEPAQAEEEEMKDDTASADAPTTNPASASTTSQPTTSTARPPRPPPNHVLMARRDEAERLANRKRPASAAAEDGSHEPGRAARDPGQAASTAASSSGSGAPGMQGPSSAT